MSTEFAGSNTFPATVTLPSDSDDRSAASVNNGLQDLSDRTIFLRSRQPDQIESFIVANTSDTTIEAHDTVTTGALAALSGANLTFDDCEVGDLLEITASWLWDTNGASVLALAYIRVTEDNTGTPSPVNHGESKRWAAGTTVVQSSVHVLHEVATAGQCVVNLMRAGVAGTGGGGSFQDSVDQYVIHRAIMFHVTRYPHRGEIL